MTRARKTFVVAHPKTFVPVVVLAGEEIPGWVLDEGLVTNPDIIGDGDETYWDAIEDEQLEDETDGDGPADETDEADVSRETEFSEEDPVTEETADVADDAVEEEQPRPDSSWKKAEIVEYAMTHGVAITGSETKDELLALLGE